MDCCNKNTSCKIHGLDDRNLFFYRSRDFKLKVKVPAWLASGDSSLPGLYTTTLLLCPHIVERETNYMLSGVSSVKAMIT